ncbi:DUF4381 domain-containing protein [Marinomonas algicola]|jgi:hypothetical protein|uniref:DUF4381 domain-containing protein n=1 Tax=Marinomonas algicola TaxID=2773454 RepID=UPI0017491BDF|nr:DUF4381 domain-containing protein [Marinomonas algicola]
MNETLQTGIDLPNKAFILPQAIPMWPPIWWSWLVLLTFLTGIIIIGIMLIRHYKKNAYRRIAIQLLEKTETSQLSDKELLIHCHTVIKRCLVTHKQALYASMLTNELLPILDKNMGVHDSFSNLGHWFIDGQYQQELSLTEEERVKLIQTTKKWIKKHNA